MPQTLTQEEQLNTLIQTYRDSQSQEPSEALQAATDEEIQAAADAPFLYQRLRAQIAAEQKSTLPVTPQRTGIVAAFSALQNQWRWALAAAMVAIALRAFANWSWLAPASNAPITAKQEAVPMNISVQTAMMKKPDVTASDETQQTASNAPVKRRVEKTLQRNSSRVRQRAVPDKSTTARSASEIATEFMPLTYAGEREDERGQIVRVEVPRATLITLGIPMVKDLSGERIKADVKLGYDGVALAIRLISDNE